MTPALVSGSRTCCHLLGLNSRAELPETPDGADDVALERSEGLARRLTFLTSARQVSARLLGVLGLREDDAVEDPVQLTMTSAIQPVADKPSGRGLKWCGAGGSSKLSLACEASTRTEDGRQLTGRQQVDPNKLCQWCEPVLGESTDPLRQLVCVLEGDSSPRRQPADSRDPLTLQGTAGDRCLIALQQSEAGSNAPVTKPQIVFRIDLHEQSVDLVSQPGDFGHGVLALADEKVQNGRLVFLADTRQCGRFLPDERSHRTSVEPVRLATLPGTATPHAGPPGVDFVDDLAARPQVLSEAPTVRPSALYTPDPLRTEGGCPVPQLLPRATRVGSLPDAQLPTGCIQRDRDVNPFVCVDSDGDHSHLRVLGGGLRADRTFSGHDHAPTRSSPSSQVRGGDMSPKGTEPTESRVNPLATRKSVRKPESGPLRGRCLPSSVRTAYAPRAPTDEREFVTGRSPGKIVGQRTAGSMGCMESARSFGSRSQ